MTEKRRTTLLELKDAERLYFLNLLPGFPQYNCKKNFNDWVSKLAWFPPFDWAFIEIGVFGFTISKCDSQRGPLVPLSDSSNMSSSACRILQKQCIFGGSDTGAATFLESPSNLDLKK
ncbi:hypothetical protein H5410_022798 [Solanum commersonii]|uniref:Uncharacterized protein n=1 Tax=Solanum commersonii TaxID=4109 RepID=A0A9J5ZGG2_SOLCO|nr:hypothetical protein H5410_022798 [Solanum commersonii]